MVVESVGWKARIDSMSPVSATIVVMVRNWSSLLGMAGLRKSWLEFAVAVGAGAGGAAACGVAAGIGVAAGSGAVNTAGAEPGVAAGVGTAAGGADGSM